MHLAPALTQKAAHLLEWYQPEVKIGLIWGYLEPLIWGKPDQFQTSSHCTATQCVLWEIIKNSVLQSATLWLWTELLTSITPSDLHLLPQILLVVKGLWKAFLMLFQVLFPFTCYLQLTENKQNKSWTALQRMCHENGEKTGAEHTSMETCTGHAETTPRRTNSNSKLLLQHKVSCTWYSSLSGAWGLVGSALVATGYSGNL